MYFDLECHIRTEAIDPPVHADTNRWTTLVSVSYCDKKKNQLLRRKKSKSERKAFKPFHPLHLPTI
jgi:hypothetical protein